MVDFIYQIIFKIEDEERVIRTFLKRENAVKYLNALPAEISTWLEMKTYHVHD